MHDRGWHDERPELVAPDLDADVARVLQHRIEHEHDPWVRWNFWGSVSSWNPGKRALGSIHLGAILVAINVPVKDLTYSEYLYGRGQPQGLPIETLYAGIDVWFDRVRTWVEAAVDQDADPSNPISTVNTPGNGLMLASSEDGAISLLSSSHRTNIVVVKQVPLNLPRLRRALKAANAGCLPSDAHLLLRDGRAALRRGGSRRAVIDAGSALELTLATFNRTTVCVNTGGRATLGWYVDQPRIAAAAKLPANLKQDLVVLRNNAIHRNQVPTYHEAVKALTLAKQVVDGLDPLPV